MADDVLAEGAADSSPHAGAAGATGSGAAPAPWFIEPWIAKPADVVVYEYGARLDVAGAEAAAHQIELSRELRHELIGCIQGVHREMNAWVLRKAGPEASRLHAELEDVELRIRAAKAASDKDLHVLVPQRNTLSARLLSLLRPIRAAHRDEMRSQFFARLGRSATAETYQLRCRAVDRGLGWATANHVLDGALLAYQRSMTVGRAPGFGDGERRDQDSLYLQFATKGGLSVEEIAGGASQELALHAPPQAQRRAYGEFRFRLGLARDGAYARGTWQYHRELPAGARVVSARLVRRRVADRYRWAIQVVLRLAQPICLEHDGHGGVAAVHFGWTREGDGRRVATIATGADPRDVEAVLLPASIEEDLQASARRHARRVQSKSEFVPRLLASMRVRTEFPDAVRAEIEVLGSVAPAQVAAGRLYRFQSMLRDCGFRLPELDEWIGRDRPEWQAAVSLAKRARGRRRDFYRSLALRLAREHRAVVLEPLNLSAAGAARNQTSGEWNAFSRHARAGKVVAAPHELEQAIRWACARHATPVFELSGPSASTCAVCGALVSDKSGGWIRTLRCAQCGMQNDRHANAAACVWRMVQQGMDGRIRGYATLIGASNAQAQRAREQRQAAVQAKRALQRTSVLGQERASDCE